VRWGPLVIGDVSDAARVHEAFKKHRPVALMHFAALALVGESVQEPGLYYRANVGGAITLLDACRIHDVQAFVFSSTCAVYGAPERLPIVEETPKNPINPYGASKLMVERVLADYEAAYGLRYAALRYFNAAGADPSGAIGERRDVETHLVPLLLDAILGRRPPLSILGDDYPTRDGTAVRDYIHVSDLAEAHVRALRRLLDGGASQALNLGTGRGYTVREVIDAAARIAGRPVPHVIAPRRPGDPPELVADASKARALLGEDLTQRSSLESIVETAWAWQTSAAYENAFYVR
jgi:UDP-glucose-4-epimerase GalE